jgi:hypothetical protein
MLSRTRRHDSRDSPRRVDRSVALLQALLGCLMLFVMLTIGVRRYRQRSEDERDRSRHRDHMDDRRPRSRGDSRSHKETDRFRDRLGSKDPASKAPDRVERKPIDASLVAAPAEDAVTEAPKERTVLKAGPAGGAYIPPFRLAQVVCAVEAAVHSRHCSKA